MTPSERSTQDRARIPLSAPTVGESELEYLRQCIAENWVASKGRFVAEFERLFASIHGQPAAVSTVSGTAALHLGCLELGIGPGDEVLVPALTFAASANAVAYTGATPVFVDVDPLTYTIDPAAAAESLTSRTRAIMPVHLYGHPADMDGLLALADEHELAIIEDATEALGSRYRGRLCGTLGDVGCFSFNGNKVITAGGGGMVLTRDPDRLAHIRHLAAQSRVPGTVEYVHDELGFNYGLSNLQAAVGLAQLEKLDEFVERRRRIAARYAARFAHADTVTFSGEAEGVESNCWLMSVLTRPGTEGPDRHSIIAALAEDGIESRPFFTPLSELPFYAPQAAGRPEVAVARDLHARGISIPSSASLQREQQDRVIDIILGVR